MQTIDFDYVRSFIYERTAIVLEAGKEYLIESRLEPLAHSEGFDSLHDLIKALRTKPFGALHHKVMEAMTTNETSFFRDIHPFETLRHVIMPNLLKQRAAEKTLNVWCAACSSGQEPYSISITLREYFPELTRWTLRCVASDLSTNMLARARSGCYSQFEVNRGLPATMLIRYFHRDGTLWQVNDDLRQLWEFRQINLAEHWPELPRMDLIFMRNVLIYFDTETKRAILGRVRQQLKPNGFLFLGTAETTLNLDNGFKRVALGKTTCYQVSN